MHTAVAADAALGRFVGAGTGVTSMVLAAVVATRWFDARRGLVLGALSAANATGQLVFLPMLAKIVEASGGEALQWWWPRAARRRFRLVLLFMRDRPEDIGLRPYGAAADAARGPAAPLAPLRRCATPCGRARSGFSPARSSSAARARTD